MGVLHTLAPVPACADLESPGLYAPTTHTPLSPVRSSVDHEFCAAAVQQWGAQCESCAMKVTNGWEEGTNETLLTARSAQE
jgi:hypothetical protein